MKAKKTIESAARTARRGAETFSVFGQIEEAAANYLMKKYPKEVTKIPTEEFPPEEACPDVWENASGDRVKFAVRVPWTLRAEFEETIKNLRA